MCSEAPSKMDDLKTGTATYMSLYPEASTDGALRLGNIVPDFSAETTHGYMESFHEWKKGKVNSVVVSSPSVDVQ
jgi:1-Cys peroxiredoxin 6